MIVARGEGMRSSLKRSCLWCLGAIILLIMLLLSDLDQVHESVHNLTWSFRKHHGEAVAAMTRANGLLLHTRWKQEFELGSGLHGRF